MSSISSSHPMHIEILGQSFTIKTDDSPEYIESLVEDLKRRYARISARMSVADPLRVAILAGLFLLDDLRKAESPTISLKSKAAKDKTSQSEGRLLNEDFDEDQILAQLDKKLGELGL
ncbi:MAG: cell division protein ZapA [Spirochaetia bacterium]|nr:cell division protein ZapA [Spirochaetia bacterium]MDI9427726.1 cell division protein ZapA [Spirochaetota bacterium]HOC27481.1 cell division protein ZapA [Rectinema sp.]